MGTIKRPNKVKLIVGLLSSDTSIFEEASRLLIKNFGRIDFESSVIDFDHTQYYKEELGEGLKRKFLSFARPADPDNICSVKIRTNRIEKKFLRNGKRRINIDPGYLSLSKLVLFSTKDYSHRIYLSKGIFAEVTLSYKDGSYNPLPWTYPDYKTKEYLDIFSSIRVLHKKDIEAGG